MPADLHERSPTEAWNDALGAVWDRILERVEEQLHPSELIAQGLLDGSLERHAIEEADQQLDGFASWLADLGMVAAARGGRALREHIEAIAPDTGRNVGQAVVAAGLIEGVRSSVETVGASGLAAGAIGDRLLVVGEPSLVVDNVIWFAASSGFGVCHREGLDGWPSESDAVLIVDAAAGSLPATVLACRSVHEAGRAAPLIVATDRSSVRDRAALAEHATSLLDSNTRTSEIIDEIRRHLHAARRPRRLALRGPGSDALVSALTARGLDVWSAENDRDLMSGLESGRASGVLLLPADDNAEVVRLLRCQPRTRRLTIVEVLSEGSEHVAAAGVDATVESVDAVASRAGQLDELLRQHTDLDVDVSGLQHRGGVPWASASFLAERVLLAAHRSDAVASVCVIRYGKDEDVAVVDAVQDALMREFRTDDIVTRNGDRENILVLGGVGAQVTHARFEGIVQRALTNGASVGVAEFPHDAQSVDDLVTAARAAIDRADGSADSAPRVIMADWHPDRVEGADVVVADPDPAAAHVVSRALERVGYTVDHIADGQVLLDRLRDPTRTPPKLLVIEFDLLSVDGLTILRRLSERAILRRLDVVVLSSRQRESDVRQAYDLGVVDVIDKPFSPGILVRRLLRVLEGASANGAGS